jgi:hypothetical protein
MIKKPSSFAKRKFRQFWSQAALFGEAFEDAAGFLG